MVTLQSKLETQLNSIGELQVKELQKLKGNC